MHLRDSLPVIMWCRTVHTFDLSDHHIYEQTLSTCGFLRFLILWASEKDSEFVMPSEHVSLLIYVNTDIMVVSFLFYVSKSGCSLSYMLGTQLP